MKKVLVLPDLQIYENNGQIDGIDLKTWSTVLNYVRRKRWDECILLGDFLDLNCISEHNFNNQRAIENQRVQKDFDAGNLILNQLQAAVKCKIVYIQGNHEYRLERLVNSMPSLEGSIEVEKGLRLKERGIQYIKFWEKGHLYKVGKAVFIHGLYTNDSHAKKTVIQFGTNVFYGHTHDIQSYSQVLQGKGKTIMGQSLGCLCKEDLPFMRGRPNKWQQAFAEFTFDNKGYFNYTIHKIFNNKLVV